jgi:uncharacterized protein (DUF697 family)
MALLRKAKAPVSAKTNIAKLYWAVGGTVVGIMLGFIVFVISGKLITIIVVTLGSFALLSIYPKCFRSRYGRFGFDSKYPRSICGGIPGLQNLWVV